MELKRFCGERLRGVEKGDDADTYWQLRIHFETLGVQLHWGVKASLYGTATPAAPHLHTSPLPGNSRR